MTVRTAKLTHTQSNYSLHYAPNGWPSELDNHERTMKTVIGFDRCSGFFDSLLGAYVSVLDFSRSVSNIFYKYRFSFSINVVFIGRDMQ